MRGTRKRVLLRVDWRMWFAFLKRVRAVFEVVLEITVLWSSNVVIYDNYSNDNSRIRLLMWYLRVPLSYSVGWYYLSDSLSASWSTMALDTAYTCFLKF